MQRTASGTFDVTFSPRPLAWEELDGFGRRAIDKRFSGDLEGTSLGEMVSVLTATKGSASYVALERVTGALHGRSGTFVLQHAGVMDRGQASLVCEVVPDSGTDGLLGLTGRMAIDVSNGHAYTFAYTLPAAR